MRRIGTTPRGIIAAALVAGALGRAEAQSGARWDSPAAESLARHATAVREIQLADTALRTYRAEARGYLTFLAQLGEGFPKPPRVVRADEIASDIYWHAPASSRQFIKGRRDTLLLPTDIRYHRDHLGIVQNNFPSVIRIGDGDEVADVPHPLSPVGLADYDFALGDSLRIVLGPRTLDVDELRFRPRDPGAPRAVGSVYVDRASGVVVRMALSFTRAALRDEELEDITVVLENGLVDGRFWLPRRQEIEIRRTGKWLDYPARGIIRGRWEIGDYQVNVPVAFAFSGGPEIEAAPGAHVTRHGMVTTPGFRFTGGIMDSLPPGTRAASSADVAEARATATQLVRARAVEQTRTPALAGRSVSDFVRANRVEGIALGAGASTGFGPALTAAAAVSYGFSDRVWKPRMTATLRSGRTTIAASIYRTTHDAGDVQERSRLFNSFAAQNFGSDLTDPYYARGVALRGDLRTSWGSLWLQGSREHQTRARINATPAAGTFGPVVAAVPLRETRVSLGIDAPERALGPRTVLTLAARADAIGWRGTEPQHGTGITLRTVTGATLTYDFAHSQLVLRALAVSVASDTSAIPAQYLAYLGGPESAPGYDYHSLPGRRAALARAEWRFRIPFVAVPLGAWGRAPASATLAPYFHAAWTDGAGSRPAAGVALLTIFDLLRVDVARGLRGGRWSLNVDVSHAFWPVL